MKKTGLQSQQRSQQKRISSRSIVSSSAANQSYYYDYKTGTRTPKFKRCDLYLDDAGDDVTAKFGFTLNSKTTPKYMIFRVDHGSPAHSASIEERDVLIEVDGVNIRRVKHSKVVQMLGEAQRTRGKVQVLVISPEGYMYHKLRSKRFSDKSLATSANTTNFTSTKIVRGENGS